ncbi:HlyD family efflux transporter periplasmic adaptor subunit [Leptospira yasudae]|uniref:efflux RND transporter periplasmic adaptor subunit n=1 Tax=Leptospira yasudae TaxID=2202201 RepID=UPI0010847A51|nr:efflux RND transporter periplasmic adaptor subunit [Leptospira yasudae]TGK23478.1 HlyD family efflux transporter periplasmic adaptor subunit [Leptospira yasudae]TGM09207.1 HlyD family efflux transporter periplasmic adaptor subunit [Leptospira yasudae]
MKSFYTKAIVWIVLSVVLTACASKKEVYYCPMHPTYTSDRPGTCPICNMDLVKKGHEDHENHSGSSTPNGDLTSDKNPMTANDDSAANGESMDSSSAQNQNATNEDHSSHTGSTDKNISSGANPSSNPQELRLSLEKQQSIGIKTESVQRRDLTKSIQAYSTVAYDPDLYTALTEYKELLRSRELLPDSSFGDQNPQIRLRQLGLSPEQIRLWTSGKRDPSELILGGKAGRAHIYSQIYESDLSEVHVGLKITFQTKVFPNKTFPGKIASIDTILDKNNRTLRLRSEVNDREQILKPQMFGDLEIVLPLKKILSIPSSAILDAGIHKMVYVQTGPDRFMGVLVKTGISAGPWVEIKEGLEEGQRVVVESAFLIDSEARIRFGSSSHKH